MSLNASQDAYGVMQTRNYNTPTQIHTKSNKNWEKNTHKKKHTHTKKNAYTQKKNKHKNAWRKKKQVKYSGILNHYLQLKRQKQNRFIIFDKIN